MSSILGVRRSPREGSGNPLQYSCMENSMDRGTWWAIVHGVAESDITEGLTFLHFLNRKCIFSDFYLCTMIVEGCSRL